MNYRDRDTRVHVQEQACPECRAVYSWTDSHRAVILKGIRWHALLAGVDVAEEGFPQNIFEEVIRELNASSGPYDGHAARVRLSLGVISFVCQAGLLDGEEQLAAMDACDLIREYVRHLRRDHFGHPGSELTAAILPVLEMPRYLGGFSPWLARHVGAMLSGKSFDEAKEIIRIARAEVRKPLKTVTTNLSHDRNDTLSVLRPAVWSAVERLEELPRESVRYEVLAVISLPTSRLVEQVREQVFLIDELLSMGCMAEDQCFSTVVGRRLFDMVDRFEELVDWNGCPTLKRRMQVARQAEFRRATDKRAG